MASVNIETVRYYERRGLIPEPQRTRAGYRQYPDDAPARIRFIRRAQGLGFTLRETRDLLALRVDDECTCTSVEEKAQAKIRLIDRKIGEMHTMRRTLERLVAACEQRQPTGECPILEILEEEVRK